MASMNRWWIVVPLTVGLMVAACSDDDGAASPAPESASVAPVATVEAQSDPTAAAEPTGGGSAAGILLLGDEEIAVGRLLCFFEEQPRAGLGGVYTHTAQAQGTNASGQPVLLDLSRARSEDGTVGDDILVDIGAPGSEEAVGLQATGPEGLVQFGEASASAADVAMTDFGDESATLSFDLSCG